MTSIRIVCIGGTTRPGSSSEIALRVAGRRAEALGAQVEFIVGRDLILPMYRAQEVDRTPEVTRLVEALRNAHGVFLASPGYHGSVSGMIKNALDYAEDLKDADPPYFEGKAVGCVTCAFGWQATGTTLLAMRQVVNSLRGWSTPEGVGINTVGKVFSPLGACLDADVERRLNNMAEQVVSFARMRAAAEAIA
jgi:FMN reductase